MKIRVLHTFCGPRVHWRSGEIIDLPPSEAQRLLDAGMAELVEQKRSKAVSKKYKKAIRE